MSPLLMSVIVFACVLGGAFLGMYLRNRLPANHLSEATKDVVKLGTGLLSRISLYPLQSETGKFQARNREISTMNREI